MAKPRNRRRGRRVLARVPRVFRHRLDGRRLGSWKPFSLHGEGGRSDLGGVGSHHRASVVGKPAKRRRRQRWVARKLSKARPLRWTKPTAGSASESPKRVERRETHQAPKSRAQARSRSVTERSERFSKSTCDWHSSVVCIFDRMPRASKDERTVRPSSGRARRTVDADDGGGRSERVLDASSGVESRTGVHIRGREVSVERHDGRRSGCGSGHP